MHSFFSERCSCTIRHKLTPQCAFSFAKDKIIYAIKTINMKKKRNFELVVRQLFRKWEPIMAQNMYIELLPVTFLTQLHECLKAYTRRIFQNLWIVFKINTRTDCHSRRLASEAFGSTMRQFMKQVTDVTTIYQPSEAEALVSNT